MAQAVLGGEDIYEEVTDGGGSPRFHASRANGREITRELVVPGVDALDTLIVECFPAFSRPGRYPTGLRLFVDDLDTKPFSKATALRESGMPDYDHFLATIVYRPLPYDSDEETDEGEGPVPNAMENVSIAADVGGDYTIIPGGHIYWSANKRVEESLATGVVFTPETTYTLTKHHVAYSDIPHAKIDELRGRVNSTTYSSSHFAFPGAYMESLLFMGASIHSTVNSFGQSEHSYSLQFVKMTRELSGTKYGWNHLFDPGTQTFRYIYLDAAGTKKPYGTFSESDLKALLLK